MSRANCARVQSLFIPWLPRGMHWARGEGRIQAESPVLPKRQTLAIEPWILEPTQLRALVHYPTFA